MTWPRPGRCGACNQPAEQYPSGRWRHLDQPCQARSRWLIPAGGLLGHDAVFLEDDAPRGEWSMWIAPDGGSARMVPPP